MGLLEALAEQFGPVFDTVADDAAVDEVEFLVIGPLLFDVVDFEADVWRYPLFNHNSVSPNLLGSNSSFWWLPDAI